MEQFYSDLLLEVAVVGHVVRLTYGVQYKKGKDEKAEVLPTMSINIPLESFANGVLAQQNVLQKMETDGLIKKRQGSPNFN